MSPFDPRVLALSSMLVAGCASSALPPELPPTSPASSRATPATLPRVGSAFDETAAEPTEGGEAPDPHRHHHGGHDHGAH